MFHIRCASDFLFPSFSGGGGGQGWMLPCLASFTWTEMSVCWFWVVSSTTNVTRPLCAPSKMKVRVLLFCVRISCLSAALREVSGVAVLGLAVHPSLTCTCSAVQLRCCSSRQQYKAPVLAQLLCWRAGLRWGRSGYGQRTPRTLNYDEQLQLHVSYVSVTSTAPAAISAPARPPLLYSQV